MNEADKIKKRITVTTLISLLLIGGVVYFAIMPQIENIKQTKREIEKQRLNLEERYIQGLKLKELSKNIKKVESEMEKMERIYIEKEETLEFIKTLESIAEKNGVEQKIDLNSAKEDIKEEYQERPLQMALSGEYRNLLSYLADIESMKYWINIKSMDITSGVLRQSRLEDEDNTKKAEQINIKVQAYVYWKG